MSVVETDLSSPAAEAGLVFPLLQSYDFQVCHPLPPLLRLFLMSMYCLQGGRSLTSTPKVTQLCLCLTLGLISRTITRCEPLALALGRGLQSECPTAGPQ